MPRVFASAVSGAGNASGAIIKDSSIPDEELVVHYTQPKDTPVKCRCKECLFGGDITPFNIRVTRMLSWRYLNRRPSKTHFHLACYFFEINSHSDDRQRYRRLQLHDVKGFTELHPVDQDMINSGCVVLDRPGSRVDERQWFATEYSGRFDWLDEAVGRFWDEQAMGREQQRLREQQTRDSKEAKEREAAQRQADRERQKEEKRKAAAVRLDVSSDGGSEGEADKPAGKRLSRPGRGSAKDKQRARSSERESPPRRARAESPPRQRDAERTESGTQRKTESRKSNPFVGAKDSLGMKSSEKQKK